MVGYLLLLQRDEPVIFGLLTEWNLPHLRQFWILLGPLSLSHSSCISPSLSGRGSNMTVILLTGT